MKKSFIRMLIGVVTLCFSFPFIVQAELLDNGEIALQLSRSMQSFGTKHFDAKREISVGSVIPLETLFAGQVGIQFSSFATGNNFLQLSIAPEIEVIASDQLSFNLAFDLRSSRIQNGFCFLDNCEDSRFLLKKAKLIFAKDSLVAMFGKQFFESGIKFDFIDFNPISLRDMSEPFSSLEDEKRLGVWGLSLQLEKELSYKLLVAKQGTPILATNENNPWTVDLPSGFSYGMPAQNGVNVGLSVLGEDPLRWELTLFDGYANAVDHMEFLGQTIYPVFPKQRALGFYLEFPWNAVTIRTGGVNHWQEDADDFFAYIIEVERFWEFENGDNLIVEIGYADVVASQNGSGYDMRRIYEGGSVLFALEYEVVETLFQITSAYNIQQKGFYFSPKISRKIEVESGIVELGLELEIIDSGLNENSIWFQNKTNDQVIMTLKWLF